MQGKLSGWGREESQKLFDLYGGVSSFLFFVVKHIPAFGADLKDIISSRMLKWDAITQNKS